MQYCALITRDRFCICALVTAELYQWLPVQPPGHNKWDILKSWYWRNYCAVMLKLRGMRKPHSDTGWWSKITHLSAGWLWAYVALAECRCGDESWGQTSLRLHSGSAWCFGLQYQTNSTELDISCELFKWSLTSSLLLQQLYFYQHLLLQSTDKGCCLVFWFSLICDIKNLTLKQPHFSTEWFCSGL